MRKLCQSVVRVVNGTKVQRSIEQRAIENVPSVVLKLGGYVVLNIVGVRICVVVVLSDVFVS